MADDRTTLAQLQETFLKTTYNQSPLYRVVDNVTYPCDEIYPNLFVGNGEAVEDVEYLKQIGITHIVNMAEWEVLTDASDYQNENIKYLGLSVSDSPSTKIDACFVDVTKFIENG